MMTYTDLMASASVIDGALHIDVPEGWQQGRATFGGLSAAIMFKAAEKLAPEGAFLRTTQICFIAPSDGVAHAQARILRQGRSATFIEVDLIGRQAITCRAVFVFGGARENDFSFNYCQSPDVAAPDDCPDFFEVPVRPQFAQHFDARLAYGDRLFTGSDKRSVVLWVRHADGHAGGMASFLAAADMVPSAILPMHDTYAPASSVTWQVDLTTDAHRLHANRSEWFLIQSEAENAGEGYTSQNMKVWNSSRNLLAASRQCVAVFG